MRRVAAAVAVIGAVAGLSGCAAPGDGEPLVVVTTNILGDVVHELVGDQAEVMTLMPADADPHSFEISARDAARMADADLLVANGLGLEEGVQHLVDAAESDGVPTVTAGELIEPIAFTDDDGVQADDPHFWMDPTRMQQVIDGLLPRLEQHVDGVDPQRLRGAADRYGEALAEVDASSRAAFAELPEARRRLVTDHHVFGYLADRYDFEVIGAIVPSGTTLAAPSASDLAGLAGAIRSAGVPAIFVQSSQPARLAEVLADEAGVRVQIVPLFSESLSAVDPGAESYLAMLRTNTERITAALSA